MSERREVAADGPTQRGQRADRPGDHRPLPAAEVGAHPAAPPGPGAGRPRHRPTAMAHIAELLGITPAEVLRHGQLLRDVQVRAGRPLLRQRLHQHLLPAPGGVGAARARRGAPRASRPAARPRTGCSPSRTSSASPPAPRRPPSRSTTASATRSRRRRLRPADRGPPGRPPGRRDPAPRDAGPRPPAGPGRPLGAGTGARSPRPRSTPDERRAMARWRRAGPTAGARSTCRAWCRPVRPSSPAASTLADGYTYDGYVAHGRLRRRCAAR